MPKPCFVPRPPLTDQATATLVASAVPLESLEDACRGCLHQDSGVLEYPKGFKIDLESEMLGTVKAYGRQIMISTSKSDWLKEVTDDAASLAGLVKAAYEGKRAGMLEKLGDKLAEKLHLGAPEPIPGSPYPGVYPSIVAQSESERSAIEEPPRLSIVNSSFISSSNASDRESVMIFPDFKAVHEVPTSEAGAKELVDGFVHPVVGRSGLTEPLGALKSWPLPYYAVILICSHKKRDTRCHQAAGVLVPQFQHHLESHGFESDDRGDDICEGPSIEEWSPSERQSKLEEALKDSTRKRVGLFKVSHIGGHRYAGNVIVYFPNGSAVWYGRVSPTDVGAIVETTVVGGKVIPELLRGGLGLTDKDQPGGVLGW